MPLSMCALIPMFRIRLLPASSGGPWGPPEADEKNRGLKNPRDPSGAAAAATAAAPAFAAATAGVGDALCGGRPRPEAAARRPLKAPKGPPPRTLGSRRPIEGPPEEQMIQGFILRV